MISDCRGSELADMVCSRRMFEPCDGVLRSCAHVEGKSALLSARGNPNCCCVVLRIFEKFRLRCAVMLSKTIEGLQLGAYGGSDWRLGHGEGQILTAGPTGNEPKMYNLGCEQVVKAHIIGRQRLRQSHVKSAQIVNTRVE